MKIQNHHKDAAKEMRAWLLQNPDALHKDVYDAFDQIADKHHRYARRAAQEVKRIVSRL